MLKATALRLTLLGSLATEMESSVELEIHLLVQWPDIQQTILRTAVQEPPE